MNVEVKIDERQNQQIDFYYKMDHTHRGLAIILNHDKFDDPTWPRRKETFVDCENLLETFTALKFEVNVYTDLTKSQMKRKLEESA